MSTAPDAYFLPHGTKWPILGSIGLFLFTGGFAFTLNGNTWGEGLMIMGALVLVRMLFGWFGTVIRESVSGLYNAKVDWSFRWAMAGFILSEVFFFSAFFGALYYMRTFAIPWLGGDGMSHADTHALLWPNFEGTWPTNGPGALGGAFQPMAAWGLPAVNTILLLTSGVTCTLAHHAILHDNRKAFCNWLLLTVLLGVAFLMCQATEYSEAYAHLNLTLKSGAYGSTFFMLTGFHGLHVTLGAIMLAVVLMRGWRGHFNSKHHFAFEAAAWYWHFVDAVWLGLFIFVYWL